MLRVYFTGIVIFLTFNAYSQNKDTILIKKHSPRKATIMSAIVPGSGQIYNRQYWKAPVVYAGMGALLYGLMFNQKYYKEYRNAYLNRHDSDITTIDAYPFYTDANLITLKDYYRRFRDLSTIGLGLLYIVNVIDATVYAHLYKFNVSQKLTVHLLPGIYISQEGTGGTSVQSSLRMKMRF